MKLSLSIFMLMLSLTTFASSLDIVSTHVQAFKASKELQNAEKKLVENGYELSKIENLTSTSVYKPKCPCAVYEFTYTKQNDRNQFVSKKVKAQIRLIGRNEVTILK